MSPSDEIRIGERLRFYRQGRGKTQAAVAGLAGVTEDYLSQIERGLKTPTITLLHQFARIPGVRVSVLLGEPEFEQNGTVHPVASEIHRAMMAYGTTGGPVDLEELRGRVDTAWSIWQTSPNRYTEGAAVLPDLVTEVQQAAQSFRAPGEADERREAARLSTDMYFLLRTAVTRSWPRLLRWAISGQLARVRKGQQGSLVTTVSRRSAPIVSENRTIPKLVAQVRLQ